MPRFPLAFPNPSAKLPPEGGNPHSPRAHRQRPSHSPTRALRPEGTTERSHGWSEARPGPSATRGQWAVVSPPREGRASRPPHTHPPTSRLCCFAAVLFCCHSRPPLFWKQRRKHDHLGHLPPNQPPPHPAVLPLFRSPLLPSPLCQSGSPTPPQSKSGGHIPIPTPETAPDHSTFPPTPPHPAPSRLASALQTLPRTFHQHPTPHPEIP
jgi:hypothetical protein